LENIFNGLVKQGHGVPCPICRCSQAVAILDGMAAHLGMTHDELLQHLLG